MIDPAMSGDQSGYAAEATPRGGTRSSKANSQAQAALGGMSIVRAASAARLEDWVFFLSVVVSGVVQVVSNEIGPWVLHDRFRHFALW
ncbi:hypothetical protein FHY04_004360 [Sphingomonas sp. BK481]|nr:hypothetical protein [Sphingomonas sp. BK481]